MAGWVPFDSIHEAVSYFRQLWWDTTSIQEAKTRPRKEAILQVGFAIPDPYSEKPARFLLQFDKYGRDYPRRVWKCPCGRR